MKTILIAGKNGMVGSALVRQLTQSSDVSLLLPGRDELDFMDQDAVNHYIQNHSIDEVYIAAARVGGIHANNTYPAEFIYQNLMIQCNIIHAAHTAGIDKVLFLGSSCIYPKHSKQPIDETQLLSGYLEKTNEPYAIAKIAGIKLCESYNRQYGHDYRSVMPTNLYGPNDNFHLENSHVIPALMRRFHEAKTQGLPELKVWGTGKAMREFMHVDDLASAAIFVMNMDKESFDSVTQPENAHINIGTGTDCSIYDLAHMIADVTAYSGSISWDTTKPDGTPRKLLDVQKLHDLGWTHNYSLNDGLRATYHWYLENVA